MSCAYEQITLSGLSNPSLLVDMNGVYVKVSQTPGFPGIAVNYWKDTGLLDVGDGSGPLPSGFRLIGPLPTSGNTFRLLRITYEGNSVEDPQANIISSTSVARTTTNQGAVCPDLLTGWLNVGSTTGTILITGPIINPITLRNNKYATATESGANRFRRLNSLGYV